MKVRDRDVERALRLMRRNEKMSWGQIAERMNQCGQQHGLLFNKGTIYRMVRDRQSVDRTIAGQMRLALGLAPRFYKGDVVRVGATVRTTFNLTPVREGEQFVHVAPEWGDFPYRRTQNVDSYRVVKLARRPILPARLGLVIGYSHLATGIIEIPAHVHVDDPNVLREDKRHVVWMIEPLDNYQSQRYVKPLTCLAVDLELTKE